ncbi:MAG: NAD(P)/FAD-dependent oxidoreductase [Bacteroidetes bacterium]|nr:NAD(P)/FAD-dependent oxidoreductase [Bacteroidota bacterium]
MPLGEQSLYDVAIIGGGIAGLSLSIQLAANGHRVIVLEKEYYPFHRVCGEYISRESVGYLTRLGYPIEEMGLPEINRLLVSAPNGKTIEQDLDMGGIGISRYKIDADLAQLARQRGVEVHEGVRVTDVVLYGANFRVSATGGDIAARVVTGSWGKRANMDIKWKRPFATRRHPGLNNYIGVKYHVQADIPANRIALHNFSDGYCGISRVEEDSCCLCYLTTARNLRNSGGSIARMEKNVLSRNPLLKQLFSTAVFEWKEPVTIAQISFARKRPVENHVLMTGDAAGMITPLCGNGMSMAMQAGLLASELISRFLRWEISRSELEEEYARQWERQFSARLRAGRWLQRCFGHDYITNTFIGALKPFPKIIAYLIQQTHGQPF